MSIEIVLIPLAIALTKEVAEGISSYAAKKQKDCIVLKSRMKDEELLKKALEEWSCSFRQVDTLESFKSLQENEVTFMLDEEGNYLLVLPKSAERTAYLDWLEKVETSYTHYLQQRVYQNLIEKAKNKGMVLENEELLEDNSIQLTYILNHS
ncbi:MULTISPECIES: hypothetical protein [Bacillus cereus group]|uniref:hypothetical protein n=1 Tax=Bacillus cereus group TaxID=86661 RepID=UPI00080F65F0|nr:MULTISPECIES: hypothetical protein [Bacillus cereus group]ANV74119.1 hypothetical protein BCM43_26995 [Bacillus thuringiensis]ANV74513.1 hypothetical protein BCM43_29210 [Bacillus thuringiensis]MCU7756672.1 hypothetical protein [Bacillus cereus]MDA2627495.1 hypothetical protein [Bacillus cereus]MDC7752728.1 hypothetical protein [Bacillus cereus]